MSTHAPSHSVANLADALALLAQGRDAVAWAFVCEHAGEKITRLCLRLTGERSLSDDAVQETLLQIRDDAGQFQPRSANPNADAWGWIMRIATNTSLQLLRRRDRARRRDQRAGTISKPSVTQPNETFEQHEIAAIVRRELAELGEPFRHAIVMHIIEGVGLAEVALAQRVPIGTVKSRVHRGLERLRQKLGRFAIAGSITAVTSCLQTLTASDIDTATVTNSIFTNPDGLLNSSSKATVSLPTEAIPMSIKLALGMTAALMACVIPLSISQEPTNPPPTLSTLENPEKTKGKSVAVSEQIPAKSVVFFVPIRPWLTDGILAGGAQKNDEIELFFLIYNSGSEPVYISRDIGFSLQMEGQSIAGEIEDLEGRQKPPLPETINLEPHQLGAFEVGFRMNKQHLPEKWRINAAFTVKGSAEPINAEISSDHIIIEER
jgi:RNA polymerase sigma-70 factor, ECF subfamily